MVHDCYAGCDISSRRLDLCILSGEGWRFHQAGNDAEGVSALVGLLREAGVALVVIEASGGYETRVLDALWAAEVPVALVPAQRVRHYARAQGEMAKTDRIDARILAEYAAVIRPEPTVPQAESVRLLRALVARRRVLVEMRAAEAKRRKQATQTAVVASLEQMLETLSAGIAALEAEIRAAIATCRRLAERARRLQSMPGIGPATAATLLAEVPELGQLARGKAAALAGLAPHSRQSGRWRGKSFISGGRKPPRDTLFMAATAAVFSTKGRFADFYRRLRDAGKPHKPALVAVMRKMIETLNTMLKNNQDFQPD